MQQSLYIWRDSDLEQKVLEKYRTLSKKKCAQAWISSVKEYTQNPTCLAGLTIYWLLLDRQGFFRKMKLSSGLHFIVSSESNQFVKNYKTH